MRLHDYRTSTLVTLFFLLFIKSTYGSLTTVARPETVLLDFLAKPFAPSDWGSPECLRDSALYLRELARYTPWALQMYDASAKIPAGLITGNYKQLGNYDECLRLKSGHGFDGQACSAKVHFEIAKDDGAPREPDMGDLLLNVAIASKATKWTSGNSADYEWMWCVPSSCNHTEIQEALEIALDPLKVEGRVDLVVSVTQQSCRTLASDSTVFDLADWIYISVLAIFALIIIASTSYDIAKQGHLRTLNRKDTKHVLLTSFSFYTNWKNLLRTDRHRDAIGCLDGLRYLSICWIIYGHTHYGEAMGVKMNLAEIPHMHHDWSTMLVLNGNICTDTFFLLSGILLAYTEMARRYKESNWRFDAIGLYVHRYLRLTPAYAMMIGFYATLFYKFGSGPHWNTWVGANKDYCRENWWTNLLYVNNYVNLPSMCMSQSWYLATDMQLVWLSPILLYPMLKFTRGFFFWLVFALALFFSVLLPFLITFFLGLSGTMLYYKEPTMVAEVYKKIYTRVYCRFGPYIIGLALGYILYKTRSSVVKIPKLYVIGGWFIAAAAGLAVIFGPRSMYFEDHVYNRIEASFYAGFHRQVFVLAISWIIFCSVHGYGGPVGKFLSWRGWIPLSRLTYSAYLCHYVFLLSDSGLVRTTGMLTPMGIVRSYFGNLCLTMLLSAIWSLCFEMPFMTIDRTLISRRKQQLGLTTQPSQGKLFGSTDSGKDMYRSTEETSSTMSQTYNDDLQGKSCNDSVYNSAGDISYHCEIHDPDNSQDIDACRKTDDEQRRFNHIYVISSPEHPKDPSSWMTPQVAKPCGHIDITLHENLDENLNKETRNQADKENYSLDSANPYLIRDDTNEICPTDKGYNATVINS